MQLQAEVPHDLEVVDLLGTQAVSMRTQHPQKDRDGLHGEGHEVLLGLRVLLGQVVLGLGIEELEAGAHEDAAMRLHAVLQPLLKVEVLAARGQRGHVERKVERPRVEQRIEDLEVLRDIEQARDVHRVLDVEAAERVQQVAPVRLPDAQEHELVRRVPGEEHRQQLGGELRMHRRPRLLCEGARGE